MEAPLLVFDPNEFYELHNPAEVPMANHPHEELIPFKTVMVADTSFDGGRVVFKWPSYRSLAYYDSDKLHILPRLDQECTISQSEASRIVKGPIDPVDLCFIQGWTIEPWVHDFNEATNQMSLVVIPEAHSNHTQMHRMRTNHFYALSWTNIPAQIAARLEGFPRIAWVSRQFMGQNETLHVEVRVPSKTSLEKFEKSVSYALPDFDQVLSISSASAELFLQRIVPMDLCFQLRRQRYFWIINVDEEEFEELSSLNSLRFLFEKRLSPNDADQEEFYVPQAARDWFPDIPKGENHIVLAFKDTDHLYNDGKVFFLSYGRHDRHGYTRLFGGWSSFSEAYELKAGDVVRFSMSKDGVYRLSVFGSVDSKPSTSRAAKLSGCVTMKKSG